MFSCPKSGWSSLTYNQVLQSAVTRSLWECSLNVCVEDTALFQSNIQAERDSNTFRMDITVKYSKLFRGCER